MPRIKRGLVDGFIYHVINRGNGKQEVFHKDEDYRTFINLMKKAKSRYPVKIFAYCIMPNHFHMILMPTKAEKLSKWMQWIMTSYVRRYHKNYGTSGHIWQGRFKSFIIQKDKHLLTVLRYVESNPVRANLARLAKDWLWSSHVERINIKAREILDKIPIELPQKWDKYVDQPLTSKELGKIHSSVNRQTPFGENEWQEQLCSRFGLEHTLRARGRPKKTEKK